MTKRVLSSSPGSSACEPTPEIIISNGFCKFHLSIAAAEMSKRGRLARFITGAYPTPFVRSLIKIAGLTRDVKFGRLIAREDDIPDALISSLSFPESFYVISSLLQRHAPRLAFNLNRLALRIYAKMAVRYVRWSAANGATLYHYRAGSGHESVREARRLGMFCLCDHSIAHPATLVALIEQGGRPAAFFAKGPIDAIWSDILDDIEQCDDVLVNSEFVKQTFLAQGWPSDRVHVLYLGVDDVFLGTIPSRPVVPVSEPLKILFAGSFGRRKGADQIVKALQSLEDVDWRLEIAGGIDSDMQEMCAEFLRDPRVRLAGFVVRSELARHMCDAEIFLFPSLAEGSARVVFEAMACGCYVITTPNAGSIVQDGVHGSLVPSGNIDEIRNAIYKVANDRSAACEIGARNAALVRSEHRQTGYGKGLDSLYTQLLSRSKPSVASGDPVMLRSGQTDL